MLKRVSITAQLSGEQLTHPCLSLVVFWLESLSSISTRTIKIIFISTTYSGKIEENVDKNFKEYKNGKGEEKVSLRTCFQNEGIHYTLLYSKLYC